MSTSEVSSSGGDGKETGEEESILQQQDELMAMESILGSEVFKSSLGEGRSDGGLTSGKILVELTLPDRKYLVVDTSTKEETLVTHLPPIVLWFTLPQKYPLKNPPLFTLSSTWLGALDLSQLCRQMDDIWKDNLGSEILFLWTNYLKEESLSVLQYSEKYAFREREVLASTGHAAGGVMIARKKSKLANNLELSSQNGKDVGTKIHSETGAAEEEKNIRSTSSSSSNHTASSDSNGAGTAGGLSRNDSVEQEQQSTSTVRNPHEDEVAASGCSSSGPSATATSKRGRRGSGKVTIPAPATSVIPLDRRAVCEVFGVIQSKGSLLNYLREYSEEKEEIEFNRSVHLCSVCFCDKMGTDFMRLRCGHAFCKDCVSACYVTHIKEGNVDAVKCLGVKCSEVPTYSKVKSAVGDELFERYDSILLQRALENMDDTTYCPRTQCGKPVILENSNERLASCSACSYRFCSKCKMVYHGVEPCRFKADERKLLFDKYTGGTAAEKTLLEKTYGKVQLKQLVETTLSEKWVAKQSKPCPHCKSPIDKFEGCNKVTCGKCNSYFCWKCLSMLDRTNPYFHFNDPQSACFNDLFENGDSGDEDEDDDGNFRAWIRGDDMDSDFSIDTDSDDSDYYD